MNGFYSMSFTRSPFVLKGFHGRCKRKGTSPFIDGRQYHGDLTVHLACPSVRVAVDFLALLCASWSLEPKSSLQGRTFDILCTNTPSRKGAH
jgi:hypothetical protein